MATGPKRRAEVEARIDETVDAAGRARRRRAANDHVARRARSSRGKDRCSASSGIAHCANAGESRAAGSASRRPRDPSRRRGHGAGCARPESRRRECPSCCRAGTRVIADVAMASGTSYAALKTACRRRSVCRWSRPSARRNTQSKAGSASAGTARGFRPACAAARPCRARDCAARFAASRASASAISPPRPGPAAPCAIRTCCRARSSRPAPARSRGCRRCRASCRRGRGGADRRWR